MKTKNLRSGGLAGLLLLTAGIQNASAAPIIAAGLPSPQTTITFSEVSVPAGAVVTTQFAALGVEFGSLSSTEGLYLTASGFSSQGLQNYFPDTYNPFVIKFAQPVTEAAFQMVTNGYTDTFTALLNGVEVETFSVTTGAWAFYGFTGITFDEIRVHIGDGLHSNDHMRLDNIQIGAADIAGPVLFSGNGHYYEFVRAYSITWGQADLAAKARSHLGVQGHLATITSAAEDDFLFDTFGSQIESARLASTPPNGDGAAQAWLGGYSPTRSTDSIGDWTWVTGETWNYSGWRTGEPNNGFSQTEASAVEYQVGPTNGCSAQCWNDSPVNWVGIEGYIVEYDISPPPTTTIDFEDGQGHDVLIPSEHYQCLSLTNAVWIKINADWHDGGAGLGVADGGQDNSGGNSVNWGQPFSDPIRIEFDSPVDHVAIDVFGVNWTYNTARLIAYNSAGDEVVRAETDSNVPQYGDATLQVVRIEADIKTVELSLSGDTSISLGDGVGWDNLTFACGNPPAANAGIDFSVNEGQLAVMLDGSSSSDPDNNPLTYAWEQLVGTSVTLSNTSAQQPTFDAPLVAIGGETLTFELTVTANGEEDSDTVDVTVVNVNHPPVADAGDDQSVAEGSPVILHGEQSFDIDNDLFSYAWVQTGGSPSVTLSGADTSNPTFTSPVVDTGGAPGVVASLVFELKVNDGFPQDTPAPGYSLISDVDSVTIEVTNVNNDPTADADGDQTVDENTVVSLNGNGSSDPDNDPLTYAWSQVGGPIVGGLTGDSTATPSFTVPFVSPGGADIKFELTVDDSFGGTATDSVVVHVQNANDPPLVSAAEPTIGVLWPPNHNLVSIGITGVSDPENNATITIYAVTQDEPTNGQGDGDTAIDAIINADGTVLLRAERAGGGNGRVYHIHFTASDLEGSASGTVTVGVPHKRKSIAIDDGELYDSTQ